MFQVFLSVLRSFFDKGKVNPRLNMSDFNNWSCINRQRKQKKIINNHFHNILRLFDVLPNFSFTTGETMRDYYLET